MSIHETLVPTDDAEVQIEATADTLKPVFAYADKLVDEFKLRVDSDGVRYRTVDPANVTSVGMEVPAEAFEEFSADETVIGIATSNAMGALRAGRKKKRDPITMSYGDRRLSTTVHRDYDGTAMDLNNNFGTVDPDSIRQAPDLPDVEEHLTASATVPRKLFEDVVDATNQVSDYIRFRSESGDLYAEAEGDVSDATAVVQDVVEGDGADALFSIDYVKDLVLALKTIGTRDTKIDEVTLRMGDEFPLRVEWETEWNDATVTGYWFQAPRIQS